MGEWSGYTVEEHVGQEILCFPKMAATITSSCHLLRTNLGNWEWKGTDSDESDRQTLYMEITSSSHVVMGPKTDIWKSRVQSGKNPYRDPGSRLITGNKGWAGTQAKPEDQI